MIKISQTQMSLQGSVYSPHYCIAGRTLVGFFCHKTQDWISHGSLYLYMTQLFAEFLEFKHIQLRTDLILFTFIINVSDGLILYIDFSLCNIEPIIWQLVFHTEKEPFFCQNM